MRIHSIAATNFGSYSELQFTLDKGLCLISGQTGAGKSTLCDLIPWCLFGKTSKGGQADEIRSWGISAPTEVVIQFDDDTYITRIRGSKNDLYLTTKTVCELRGKDIPDTQKLINQHIGMTLDTYLAGSYLHEFSQTSQFFTTTAKVRRGITEQIVDLGLASDLTLSLIERRKTIKANLEDIKHEIASKTKLLDYIADQDVNAEINSANWVKNHTKKISNLEDLSFKFENDKICAISKLADKASLLVEELKNTPSAKKCPTCGNNAEELHKQHLEENIENLMTQIESEERRKNPYVSQIENTKNDKNPFLKKNTDAASVSLNLIALNRACDSTKLELSDAEILTEVIETFRTSKIESAIDSLESETNRLLRDHFDGEISVSFEAEDKDKLEATIYKDGNLCSYTQLSKGQRQMLKLCFGVSVMKAVSTHNSVTFDTLWFDECLAGLDDSNAVKSYRLMEELNLTFPNIFLVDHNEALKSCFINKIVVLLRDGRSQVET